MGVGFKRGYWAPHSPAMRRLQRHDEDSTASCPAKHDDGLTPALPDILYISWITQPGFPYLLLRDSMLSISPFVGSHVFGERIVELKLFDPAMGRNQAFGMLRFS